MAEEDAFLVTTLKVVYVLITPMPELLEDATVETIRIREKWENDDYICRGHILNDDLSLVQLGIHLRIEESLKAQDNDKGNGMEVGGPSVNITEEGIIHETTAPYTPQQNSVAERKNKVLKEMVNSMLSYSGLSEGFWGEVMLMACYLLNMVPNKKNKISSYEIWFYVIEPNDSVSINSIIESRDAIFD
uniref:Zinc finger, CCHC-type n=1 Tax=Tanacetum cinerariifolium TaxID=118510 RepID=A0A6L2JVI5_TANCI|nr:zinc finger, CCHC-type [Tanacetum cinerariifolium]